jgi:2-polyprenyl-3-methyl-5-hydroxy-6-metoxy-1,4-benzoquinol methylase
MASGPRPGWDPSPRYRPTVLRSGDVFAQAAVHNEWESVYRGNPLLDALNDSIMNRLMIKLNPPTGAIFLDAGCGVGDQSLRIARKGYRCFGIDVSEHVLRLAKKRVFDEGLCGKISFSCQSLTDLPLADNCFDAIHCRGVLMHIPEWEKALSHLCRVLKPGGRIAIMESNGRAPQARAITLARRLGRRGSTLRTPAGDEFWKEKNGQKLLIRAANLSYLSDRLLDFRVQPLHRFSTSLLAIGMFPKGPVQNAAIRLNRSAFALALPPWMCHGNVIIGEKAVGLRFLHAA